MIDLSITDEEIESLKEYFSDKYVAINQMLVSNCETDIAIASDDVEEETISILYDRESIIHYLQVTKNVYRLILKDFYSNFSNRAKSYKMYRGTNIAEIERMKTEVFVDRMLSSTVDEKDAINKYAAHWNRPSCMKISLDNNVPYIFVNNFIPDRDDVLIAPFTKIRVIIEADEQALENQLKNAKIYNVELEKQSLVELQDKERYGVYNYVLENAYSIKKRIEDCIYLEKENTSNYENIRRYEHLIAKYENELEDSNTNVEVSSEDISIDKEDITKISKELEELKEISNNLFEQRKENINFVNVWKRNIAVYMMAECKEIENKFEEIRLQKMEEFEITEKDEVVEENSFETIDETEDESEKVSLVDEKNDVTDKIELNNEDNSIVEENSQENNNVIVDVLETDEDFRRFKAECKENNEKGTKLLEDINSLILKQQNHARIAGSIGSVYSALNNAFEMRKSTEKLLGLMNNIQEKVNSLCVAEEKEENLEKLNRISTINIEINTLINYLNNPKILLSNSKVTRFDEISIIEENELKRGISSRIRDIRGEAELKKLKDDLDTIEGKNSFERFIGIFTGENKLDDFKVDQIEMRQKAIRKTLARDLGLTYNYSIHEIMAEIEMFVGENDDDYLIQDEVKNLQNIANELRRDFVILESKVSSIIKEREGRNLPIEQNHKRKLTKKDLIEVETYRFLNKYGYDISSFMEVNEPAYQDTMSNEINRIIEYINTADILS